ncbi:ACT domain-containing protein [Stappia taiwanensis]|uniref:prephenate dehydratase n=2 Tax=Stappia taiwanensis TaxID=992267 RepID=A0A838XME5_9HYPH|nr:ACT domain-containing protein [Stappia taiwanensis]
MVSFLSLRARASKRGGGRSPGEGHTRGSDTGRTRPALRVVGRGGGDAALRSVRAGRSLVTRQEPGRTSSRMRFDPDVIVYHGSPGAFAHVACQAAFPRARCSGCDSLFQVIDLVRKGKASAAMLPCENILAGRVPDTHLLLPDMGLAIVGEVFQRIELHLMAPEGCTFDRIERVHSHPVALAQIQRFLSRHALVPVEASNTATAAARLRQDPSGRDAAVASQQAARIHGLKVLKRNIEDVPFNMTRSYVLAAKPELPCAETPGVLTCLLFDLRNTPGALSQAVKGFADNGVNLTRLESYLVDGQFVATRFLCEIEGHPHQPPVARALDRLKRHTSRLTILGVFPMQGTGVHARAGAIPASGRACVL